MIHKIEISKYILLFFISIFVVGYLGVLVKLDDFAHLGMSVLYFLAVGKFTFEYRKTEQYATSPLSLAAGLILLGCFLWPIIIQAQAEWVWRIMPFGVGMGIVLLVSPFQLQRYWQELAILFVLGIPRQIISAIYDPSPLTASMSGTTLWYIGFEARVLEKVYVMLPAGGVKVYEGCSGLESVCYVFGISVICLILYPVTGRFFRWVTPIVACLIGFFVNMTRVMALALLNAYQQSDAFVYWHEGEGSLIFGMIAVLLFSTFYYFLPQENNEESDALSQA